MPAVPPVREVREVNWECQKCGHTWEGKPKTARANGNPTCSSCGRRSGSQLSRIQHAQKNTELSNDEDPNILLELALKATIDCLHNKNQRVM